jgi:cation diffusion facilitator CzcD-associated flavoprotein CzcO
MSHTQELRIVVIGAGMSGILWGIKLQEAGFDNFQIYEKNTKLGGTWHENTYPGLSCDVPSHLYRYSFEPNPEWTHVFSPGSEICGYFETIAQKYGVERFIAFEKELTECVWKDSQWHLEMKDGQKDVADIVVSASGVLHHPRTPEIAGLHSFEGACFHSARWDHSVSLDNQRVGVIGTGSTGIQIVSALSQRVKKLCLFQRTPQWIMPQNNLPYSEEEKDAFRRDPAALEKMYADLTKSFSEGFATALVDAESEGMKQLEGMCLSNLEESVHDPVLREKLRPNYRAACKRLVISGEFYEAIQRPSAELVVEDIDRIEPTGVKTVDGKLHELDVLVLATGFHAHQFMRPMNVTGRNGITLDDVWPDTTHAYRSVSIPGFPNFFMTMGPHSPVGNFSLIEVAEIQLAYVMQLIDLIRKGQYNEIAAGVEATERFNEERIEATQGTIWASGCKSWYLDANGIPASWPWSFERYHDEMAKPDLGDFELIS